MGLICLTSRTSLKNSAKKWVAFAISIVGSMAIFSDAPTIMLAYLELIFQLIVYAIP